MSVHDFLVAPVWLAVNLLLVGTMWRLAERRLGARGLLDRIHSTIVLCWACVVAVAIVSGSIGALSATALLGTVTAVAVAALWMAGNTAPLRATDTEASRGCRHDFNNVGLANASPYDRTSPGAEISRGASASGEHEPARSRVERWCWMAWCVWAALCAGRVIVSGLLEHPTNWDTLTYHLPLVDQWLSTGSLYVPGVSKWFYPGNSELVALWMVAPFSGDFLAPLNNFLCVLLLILAGLRLARIMGVALLTGHLAVLVMVSNYVVWHQVMDNKNDLATAGLFLSCLAFGLQYSKNFRTSDLLLTAICLGLLAGTKYYALLYAGLAGTVVVLLTAAARGLKSAAFVLVLCAIGFFIWAGYWYGRNLLLTGTPLYPKTMFAASDVETGARSELWTTTLLGNPDQAKWPLWLEVLWRITGPCHVISLIVLPASLWWLLLDGLNKRRSQATRTDGNFRWALLSITILSGLIYGVTPFTVEVAPGTFNMVRQGYVTIRLGFAFFSLTVLCVMVLIHDTAPLPQWWVAAGRPAARVDSHTSGAGAPSRTRKLLSAACLTIGLCAVACQFFVEARLTGASFVIDRKLSHNALPSLLVAVDLLVLAAIVRMAWPRKRGRRVAQAVVITGALGLAAVAAGLLGHRWHGRFASFYDELLQTGVFAYLEQTGSDVDRICVLVARSYPFAGSRRERLVWQAHDTGIQPQRFRTEQELLEYLRERDITLVAVPPGRSVWGKIELGGWGDQHPGAVTTIWQDDQFVLYRVDLGLLAPALTAAPADRQEPARRTITENSTKQECLHQL